MKLSATLLLALATASTPALAAARLDDSVVPVAYDIKVMPDAQAMRFSGTETVGIDVKRATRTITLNAAALTVSAVTFDGRPARFSADDAAQQLTVALPSSASIGHHRLTFAWTGTINQSASGFFAIDYTNKDGSKARMLATQFEAPDARRFAPMWDEPGFKATYTLTTTAPKGQIAFSNMPAAAIIKAGDGSNLYRFATTPRMSSYLLFLGIGDMERKTVMAGKTEIGVITRRGVVDQGDYALASAKRLLAYYNDYFGQPYPLPKLDMIAGPGSSQFFGAMENWGAIFYFEPELLFDPKRASESGRQRIHVVVAHEMAHQWFGDLVTPEWWDDLWLNEGFASWMENKAGNDLNPAWHADAAAVSEDREGAMAIDATAATHPIVRHVETVDQIGEAFDSITYQKGEAVIGMLESTLGPDVFRDGIRHYMAKYKYGSTVTDQLWAELSAAAGKPVADIAHDFTLQGGVPLITLTGARCVGGMTTATLVQGRFGLDIASMTPQTWRVPMRVGTLGGETASAVVRGPAPATVSVKGCGTLVLNEGKGSYFRALYDDAGHAAIVRDYPRLALADRLGTVADDFALVAGGYQPFARWQAVTGAIGDEANPLEWSLLSGEFGELNALYDDTPLEAPLRARAATVFARVLARLGFDAKPGESPLATDLREDLVWRVGASGDADVRARARRYVMALRTDPNAIPAPIRQPILRVFAVNATPADWEALLAMTKAETNPVVKNGFVALLGSARDPALAQRSLDLVATDAFTAPQRASLLRAVSQWHADLAFDWAVSHQALVNGFLEESTRAGYIVSLAEGSNDPAMPGKIDAFATKSLAAGSRGGVVRAKSEIAVRKQTADRMRAGVAAWLGVTG